MCAKSLRLTIGCPKGFKGFGFEDFGLRVQGLSLGFRVKARANLPFFVPSRWL